MSRIVRTDLNFEREPLAAPWGFKGGYLTELWQSVALLQTDDGLDGLGLGVQSVLWSDPRVFAANSEPGGNSIMLMLTQFALTRCRGMEFRSPFELLDSLLPEVMEYGMRITGLTDLNPTFALNALVAVDNAAWRLHAAQNQNSDFDSLLPAEIRSALNYRQEAVISVPAVGYGLALSSVSELVDDGYFVFKIKIGSDPDKDGDPEKMLQWDCARIADIHQLIGSREVKNSPSGRPLYYLDANSRYDSLDRINRLVDHLETIGALSQTVLLEEPMANYRETEVSALPIRVVADESATDVETVKLLFDLGYGAVALKPIAKTMSMSLRIAELCHQRGVPAFCADLTVNPVLLDWNKVVACRLAPIPGLQSGLQETNGFQNYRDWDRLIGYHSAQNAGWLWAEQGEFRLDDSFYDTSGGIFNAIPHYESLVHYS